MSSPAADEISMGDLRRRAAGFDAAQAPRGWLGLIGTAG
jgi:hypothetical protein